MLFACCVFAVLVVALFRKNLCFPLLYIQKAGNEPSRSHLAAFFCPKNGKEDLCYGTQNHAEAAEENQCAYLQTSQSILLGKFI